MSTTQYSLVLFKRDEFVPAYLFAFKALFILMNSVFKFIFACFQPDILMKN